MEPLELRTHTRLWQVEKKLYKLYDFTLPVPVSIRMGGIFIASAAVWFTVCKFLGVEFSPPFGHLIWIAPPVGITFLANRPVAEGKRMGELLISQFNYYATQHRQYARLAPSTAPEKVLLTGSVWHPRTLSAGTVADTTAT